MATRKKEQRQTKAKKTAANPATPFSALPDGTRKVVAGRLIGGLRKAGYLGRGKYDVTSSKDSGLRERLYAEHGGEETALTVSERNRLVAMVRNLDRNSEHLNGFLKQLELNVVGTSGGKASFSFPTEYAQAALDLRETFAEWARECEFFDGLPLQGLLKLSLRTKYTSGRAVILFDDGVICDSGKVVVFEGDCMANIEDEKFREMFPVGWSQHQGLIKDANGQTVGAFVSESQRGSNTFRLTDDQGRLAVWALRKDASTPWIDAPFCLYSNVKRINQIVSVPGVAPSVGSIMDLEALAKYEMQTAKKSAQTIATVTQPPTEAANLTDGLDPTATMPVEDGEDVHDDGDDAKASVEDQAEELTLPDIEGAGTIYDVLPPGLKMELLNPTHPNSNVTAMVSWFKQCASWANGAANLFATGRADGSYSSALVEQAITWPMFEDEQQQLRRVLDWIVRRWAAWAERRGMLSGLKLPANWIRRVAYTFPTKREPDAGKEQSAIAQGLKNCTMSLRDKFGPDWREKLDLLEEELNYCRDHGIPHPALQTVSGQIIDQNLEVVNTKTEKETE